MASSFSFPILGKHEAWVTVQEGKHGEGAWLPRFLSVCHSFFSGVEPHCQEDKSSQICFQNPAALHQGSLAVFEQQIEDILDRVSSENCSTVSVKGLTTWLDDLAPLLRGREFGSEETGYEAHLLEMCRELQGPECSKYPRAHFYDKMVGILNLITLAKEEDSVYLPSPTEEETPVGDQLRRASLTSIHSPVRLIQQLLLISESIPRSQCGLSEKDQNRVILLWMKQILPLLLSQMDGKKEELIRLGCDLFRCPEEGLNKIITWISDKTSWIDAQFTEERTVTTLSELSEELIVLKTGREVKGFGQYLSRTLVELERKGHLLTWWKNRVSPTLELHASKEELESITQTFSAGRNEEGLNRVSLLLFQLAQRRWRRSLCAFYSQGRLDQVNRQHCTQYPSWKEALEDRRSSLVRSGTCMAIYLLCKHLLGERGGECSIPSLAQLQERERTEGENFISSVWEEVNGWMDESTLGIFQKGIYRQILRLFAFVIYRIAEKSSRTILHKVYSCSADPNQWDNFVIDMVKALTQGINLEQAGEEAHLKVWDKIIYWGIDQLVAQLSPCEELSEAQSSVMQWGRSPSCCVMQKVAKRVGAEASIVVIVLIKWLMKRIFSLFSLLLKKGAARLRLSERVNDKITSIVHEKSRDPSTQYVLFSGLFDLVERVIEKLDVLVSKVPVPKSFQPGYSDALSELFETVLPAIDPGGWSCGRDFLIKQVGIQAGGKALHNARVILEVLCFSVMDQMCHPPGSQDVPELEKSWEEVDEMRCRFQEKVKELVGYLVDDALCRTVADAPTQQSAGIDCVDWLFSEPTRGSLNSVFACVDRQTEEEWFDARSEVESLQAEEAIEEKLATDESWRKTRDELYLRMHTLDKLLQIQEYYGQDGRENALQVRIAPVLEKISDLAEACQDSRQDAMRVSQLSVELEEILAHSGLTEWRREQGQRKDPDNTWGHFFQRGGRRVADTFLWRDRNQGLGQPHRVGGIAEYVKKLVIDRVGELLCKGAPNCVLNYCQQPNCVADLLYRGQGLLERVSQ